MKHVRAASQVRSWSLFFVCAGNAAMASTAFENLPDDILSEIFSYLEGPEALAFVVVSFLPYLHFGIFIFHVFALLDHYMQ
jgi:hypothetical protein